MRRLFRPFTLFRSYLPKGLYARSLIIIIAPVVLLQAVISYIFFERHWQLVTRRLSSSVASEIAFLIETAEQSGTTDGVLTFAGSALAHLSFQVGFQDGAILPEPKRRQFRSILDDTIRRELDIYLDRPFWFDTETHHPMVDIRVQLDTGVLQVLVRRSRVYATNWHIFLVWMVVISMLLLSIAILFLRNQVRPILRLADVAEAFGLGRDAPNFKPAGAREVRIAAQAFIDMRDRLRRSMEQRTEILAGVSHDLRTPLTRMKLQLAMMGQSSEINELREDVTDMERMVEEFLDFARGQGGEEPELTDLGQLLSEICARTQCKGQPIHLTTSGDLTAHIRKQAVKRCIANLVDNACSFGKTVEVSAGREADAIAIAVDDDGPGIPDGLLEDAFRPFHRLDESRNPDRSGVGLGLSIARDIARAHGGEITLSTSPMGGLRALLRVPV